LYILKTTISKSTKKRYGLRTAKCTLNVTHHTLLAILYLHFTYPKTANLEVILYII